VQKLNEHEASERVIVYLDESGFAVDMPRTHGYSSIGLRCYGKHDWQAKGRLNAIGAIVGMSMITVSLFPCHINADVFHAWMTQDLLPKVKKGSVIVMDNASFHKRENTLNAIKAHGCITEFLPPYSPDLNPIEKKWAQVKSIRRKERCDIEALFREHVDYAILY